MWTRLEWIAKSSLAEDGPELPASYSRALASAPIQNDVENVDGAISTGCVLRREVTAGTNTSPTSEWTTTACYGFLNCFLDNVVVSELCRDRPMMRRGKRDVRRTWRYCLICPFNHRVGHNAPGVLGGDEL